MTLVGTILNKSKEIHNHRTVQDVLNHAMTELGELALEVQIDQGKSYKQPGADGIVGEALDLVACMIDMIYVHNPDLTEDDMIKLMLPKLIKWKEKANQVQMKQI